MRNSIIALALSLCACASSEPAPAATQRTAEPALVSKANLGKQVTLRGVAQNRKNGAVLVGDDFEVWIDGLHGWPDDLHQGGDRGAALVVTGTLGEDHGSPVFVQKPDEPIKQGIPVPEGTDLEAASHRFLLRDATWERAQ